MVNESLAAAKKLEDKGVSAEVIDVRTIQPLDLETIVESVKRTSRLVIASDDVKRGGVGAEISASITESAFDYLDAPITQVAYQTCQSRSPRPSSNSTCQTLKASSKPSKPYWASDSS